MEYIIPTIILMLTVYSWFVVVYVVFNLIYTTLGKRGVFVVTLRKSAYDFCKPLFTAVNKVLPQKYADFGPLIIFVFLQIVAFTVSKLNF